MNLITAFVVLGAAGAAGLLGRIAFTRAFKLSRKAKAYGCRFERHKNSVTTALTAGRLEFFTRFFHQYKNVFTFSDHMAFIRLADDFVFKDDKPGTHATALTLFTAEMRTTEFPALKVTPISSPFAPSQYTLVKTNIPAIDAVYRIHAPSPAAGILFTPAFIGLLKTNHKIYLELNDNALIYHEHTLVSPEKLEDFRFRALQILSDFETRMVQLNASAQAQTRANLTQVASTEAERRAQAILGSFQAAPLAFAHADNGRWIWLLAVIIIFAGMTFLSWFLANNFIGK